MSGPGLTPLQRRTLTLLAAIEPTWTLTGGAALIGAHGILRTTRDLDLIAEPVPAVEAPEIRRWGAASIQVDSAHELLVNKLCALLHRSELRDLGDIGQLLAAGGDLDRALDDAPRKEAGFSPLTLAWLLSELPIQALTAATGGTQADAASLTSLRDRLVTTLAQRSRSES